MSVSLETQIFQLSLLLFTSADGLVNDLFKGVRQTKSLNSAKVEMSTWIKKLSDALKIGNFTDVYSDLHVYSLEEKKGNKKEEKKEEKIKCMALVKDRQCKNNAAPEMEYCKRHATSLSNEGEKEKIKCMALVGKSKDRACKNNAAPNSKYCKRHVGEKVSEKSEKELEVMEFEKVMITTFRKERSFHGHSLDVLKSGLQKYIRRGMFDEAMYCALELKMFKDVEGGARLYTNFIHRLYVILLEDVANISIVDECVKNIKNGDIYSAVKLMCFSDKARICSHARAVFTTSLEQRDNPLIVDVHKGIDHSDADLNEMCERFAKSLLFKQVSAIYYAFQITNSMEKLAKPYKRRRNPVWFIFQELRNATEFGSLFEDIFIELGNLKECFLCWLLPLLHYLDIVPNGSVSSDATCAPDDFESEHKKRSVMEMDDFVFDKHTKKGTDKSRKRFVEVGAVVYPEAKFIVKKWKDFYEGVQTQNLETKYELIVRAQLVTRGKGQDTYFARDSSGNVVFVKGPFADESKVKNVLDILEWKKEHQLPFIEVSVEYLIPDRWPNGTPLGLRNSLDRDKAYPFLISPSVITEIKVMTHQSKLWPPTEVSDMSGVRFHLRFNDLTHDEMTDYVLNLLMRYLFGIGDLADRNFIHHDGRIVSIDEDARKDKSEEVNLERELKKNRWVAIGKWMKKNYEEIKPVIRLWEDSLNRLGNIQDKFA